jgi:hypothetical protein
MSVRAKFLCHTVEMSSDQPTESQRWNGQEMTTIETWPRTYRFSAVTDSSTPENERYAQATPSGQLTIQVDNPAVSFERGKSYYLDFTPADEG